MSEDEKTGEEKERILRVRVFVDGTWLLYARRRLIENAEEPLDLDWKGLPHILAKKMAEDLGISEFKLEGCTIFGSFAKNVDPVDKGKAAARERFYGILNSEFGYGYSLYAVDFKGQRLHQRELEIKEKRVDVALASKAVYQGCINAYDGAVFVIGDQDYIPALEKIREMNKHVMIASIRGSCHSAYDPYRTWYKEGEIFDCKTIFLDDILKEVTQKYSIGIIDDKIDKRGFGFIKSGDEKFYFHRVNTISDFSELHVSQPVYFLPKDEVEPGHQYRRAIIVKTSLYEPY